MVMKSVFSSLGDVNHLADDVMKKLFPDLEVPSAFETVGHIAHLNLNDAHMPHRFTIGSVLLDVRGWLASLIHLLSCVA